ncbi:MAG: flagellar hook-length control protein FliK [Patiriisocius sp.]|jgi:flagellar hook-length control protein FliK
MIMPESTTNIFSMVPPVPIKSAGTISGRSSLGGDSSSQDSSSFSSKLSHAEDQQRSGVAERDLADKRDSSGRKQTALSEADDKSKNGKSKATINSTGESTAAGASVADVVTSETLASASGKQDGLAAVGENQIAKPPQELPHVTVQASNAAKTGEVASSGKLPNVKSVSELISNEATNATALIETTKISSSDIPISGLPVSERPETKNSDTDELADITADLKGAAESDKALPIVGLNAGNNNVEPGKAAATPTTDSTLLSSSRNGAVSSGILTDSTLASTPTPTPTSASVNAGDNVASLPAIDKRLGRLSSTVEPFEASQADSAVILGETKNSQKIGASVMNVHNQAMGVSGEQAINQSIQLTEPTLAKGEKSKGILISDLALSKEGSLAVRGQQAVGIRTAAPPPLDGVESTPELDPVQIVTQLNQSAGRNESSMSDLARGSSGSTTLDQMLTASTSGIVTAPNYGRFDLTSPQSVTTPVPAPLNVLLLSSNASEALSGNIRWMVGEGIQNATVSVTPSGMGPITVQIGVEKDQMSISIIATQAGTREALEAAVPRLREQLGTQGLESVRVDVSDGRSDQSKSNTGSDRQAMGGNTDNSQNQSAENTNNESSSARFGNNNDPDSGERVLSDTERELLSRLQELSTDSSVGQSTIRHGYDLYV